MARSAQQQAEYAAQFEKFAELLSLDIPQKDIARRLGVTKGCTCAMMRQLREKYGWQAQ